MADHGRGGGKWRGGRWRGRGADRGGGPGGADGSTRGGPPRGGPPRGGPPSPTGAVAAVGRGAPRGGPRGAPADRGRGARGRGQPTAIIPSAGPTGSTAAIAESVEAIGAKRPGYGTLGIPIDVIVNCFKAELPTGLIYHYDNILPGDKTLPTRLTVPIIRRMQEQYPTIFTKRGSYDGRKNLYSPVEYSLGDREEFEVNEPGRPWPRLVHIKYAATINPSSLVRYIEGKMSHDNQVLTTLNACNVAIRMQPIQNHPFNSRSFYTRTQFRNIGWGVELWRGYFQSVRPVVGKMVINADISAAAFYKSGPLIKLCLEYLGANPEANPVQFLSATRLDHRKRRDLAKFLRNLNVQITRSGQTKQYSIKARRHHDVYSSECPPIASLDLSAEKVVGLEAFFQDIGHPLQFPTLVTARAWYPLEVCQVVPGQFYRSTLNPDQTRGMVDFSTSRPEVRLQSIRDGLQALQYGSSTYLQDFEINVDPNPLTIKGRILPTPTLLYGRNATIQPRDGQWNMRDKTLYKPEKILGCAIIVYDRRFNDRQLEHVKRSFFNVTQMLGMQGMPADPPVLRKDGTGTVYANHIREAALMWKAVKGNMPNLILVILPDMAEDIYTRIKNAGDIKIGVATQCMRASKCGPPKGNEQYYVNVCLKINAKLGGINVIPKPDTVRFLTDRAIPTIVIGADIQHPGPGVTTRPSYAAVVGSVDSDASKYIAVSRAQGFRQEMIQDLADMIAHIIKKYMHYRKEKEGNANPAPRRILFYRDGISEGEFQKCKEQEVAQIFSSSSVSRFEFSAELQLVVFNLEACDNIGIPRPKLTFVVVGKNHHIRFFPPKGGSADRSGNAPAGLVVDREITSPVEYDFYLQSHGGLLGTSRSAHYNVLVDQNNFMPDDLQRISFSLCHVYARSTRSVSIVPPVYYADSVCTRSKHHYDPDGAYGNLSDSASQVSTAAGVSQAEAIRNAFQPVHPNAAQTMYFQ
ncbi:hypothetical protein M407DRAFT_21713 [Tulasnella calospora MUT 4182]|uniref:Piwi domain-containing protein n=1 Tax=Tulasnella calospora MUT 4182 TaxID=1051891 RepID=A0A0C3L5P6_9AGAM|nr:hypothetical protein M407DRAFT_21713 [Tulasnella calospora MUT 4182]